MVGIRSGKEINPDATTFYYESNNNMESLLKTLETTYTYSQLRLLIGPWLNFRKI